MTTSPNIKQIGCVICIAVLLAGAIGCTERENVQTWLGTFEVNDEQYVLWLYTGWDIHTDRQGRVASSFLTLNRTPAQDRPNYKPILVTTTSDSARNIRRATMLLPDGKEIVPKAETLYFAKDKNILVEKDYRELGIDASKLKDDFKVKFDYLRPILEPLIREHFQPQEPEMEVEQP